MKSFENIKSDFPIFERKINGKPLTYLDSGATSQKPNVVLEKMNEIYKVSNANVHRGTYALSAETTLAYEGCLLYTSPSPRDGLLSRMPSSA